jgi:hypothetical protein
MSYKIAGIDVHKKVLAVVVSDVEIESEYHPSGSIAVMNLSQRRVRTALRR